MCPLLARCLAKSGGGGANYITVSPPEILGGTRPPVIYVRHCIFIRNVIRDREVIELMSFGIGNSARIGVYSLWRPERTSLGQGEVGH